MKLLSSKIKESTYIISEFSQIYTVSRATLTKLKNVNVNNLDQIQIRKFSNVDARTRKKLIELINNFSQT